MPVASSLPENNTEDAKPSPIGKAKRRRLRRQKGSQPRLAALGSPFQGKGLAWTLPPSYGRGENAASQTSHEEGLRYENAVFPILSFRAKARNLFRSRSGKSCEGSGERETPYASCDWGSRCFMQMDLRRKTANGERKRSLGCARDDETRKRFPPIPFQSRAEANLCPFGAPPSRGRRKKW